MNFPPRIPSPRSQDSRPEEVPEEPGQPGRRPGRVLGSQVKRLHPDKHHRAVDEETDGDQG